MNGSLSPSVLLSLRSSLSTIPRALFPHLDFRHLSLPRSSYTRRAPSVRRSVRSPLASTVVLSTLPYTLQRFNVSHGIFYPPLGFFACLSLLRSFSLFSLYLSFECYLFISFLLYLRPPLRNYFFFFFYRVKVALFQIFCFVHITCFLFSLY